MLKEIYPSSQSPGPLLYFLPPTQSYTTQSNQSCISITMGRPKRNVLAAAEQALSPPDNLEENQVLVRVIKPEGNNLYACELPNKKDFLLELAQRFRNTIWIRRGGFVVAELYPAGSEESRAAGEIVNIVRDEKLWRKQSYW
jgi:probable RNA-binding protein EIF1AD